MPQPLPRNSHPFCLDVGQAGAHRHITGQMQSSQIQTPPPTPPRPTPQPPNPPPHPPNSPNPPLHHSGLSVSFHKASNYGPGVRSPGLHCVTNWVNPAGLANRSAIPEAQYCRRAFICPETFQRAGNSLISWQKLPTWGFSPCFSAETGAELPCT